MTLIDYTCGRTFCSQPGKEGNAQDQDNDAQETIGAILGFIQPPLPHGTNLPGRTEKIDAFQQEKYAQHQSSEGVGEQIFRDDEKSSYE